MGDFDFLLGNDYVRQQQPYEPYKRLLTMRALADEREARRLQVQEARMKLAQQQREEQEQQAFRDLLRGYGAQARAGTGAPATTSAPGQAAQYGYPPELIQRAIEVAPKLGFALATDQAKMTTEQRQALTAAATLDKETLARNKEISKRIADLGMTAAQIEDPLQRALFHGRGIAAMIDEGILKPEDFTKKRIPGSQQEAEMAYGSAYGVDPLQKLRADRAKRAEEAAKAVEESTTASLNQQKTQAELDKLKNPPPGEAQRQFLEIYYPGWLVRHKAADSAEQRSLAFEDFKKLSPGIQLMTPDVFEQQTALAKAKAEAKPPSDTVTKQVTGLKDFGDALAAYKAELQATGPVWGLWDPKKAATLKAAYETYILRLKELENLGALAGPDLGLLRGQVADPTELSAQRLGKEGLLAQLAVGEEGYSRNLQNFAESHGLDLKTTFPKWMPMQSRNQPSGGIPKVGDTFQGSRVKSVTRVK